MEQYPQYDFSQMQLQMVPARPASEKVMMLGVGLILATPVLAALSIYTYTKNSTALIKSQAPVLPMSDVKKYAKYLLPAGGACLLAGTFMHSAGR